jgi:hypothetical protein
MNHDRDLDLSRPFDVHTWSEHPEVHLLVDAVWDEHFAAQFDPNTGRQGRRSTSHPRRQLQVLLLDLYLAWKTHPGMSIGIGMSNRSYQSSSRYNALHISPVMIRLVHRAHEVGLVGLHRGSQYSGRTTRIWAEQPLVDRFSRASFGVLDIAPYSDQESIILSMGEGNWMEYTDNPWIEGMRASMRSYNRLISRTFIDIPTLDYPVVVRPPEPRERRPTQVRIDQNDKFTRRIFYRGDWRLGGRYHGGFYQKLPEHWRSQLWINDLPVIEDDYSGIHIALLYGMEGKPLRGDPYNLHRPHLYPAAEFRKWVKQLALVAINAGDEGSAFRAFRRKQPTGSPAKSFTNQMLGEMLNAFKKRHPAIAQYMCSDEGVRLMAIDGRITARIAHRFTAEGVPVLTVYDSYVIDVFHARELRLAMREAMDAEVPGASTSIDRTGNAYKRIIRIGAKDTPDKLRRMSLDRIGGEMSQGYQARRNEFLSVMLSTQNRLGELRLLS